MGRGWRLARVAPLAYKREGPEAKSNTVHYGIIEQNYTLIEVGLRVLNGLLAHRDSGRSLPR